MENDKMHETMEELRELFDVKTYKEAINKLSKVLPLVERINKYAGSAIKEIEKA